MANYGWLLGAPALFNLNDDFPNWQQGFGQQDSEEEQHGSSWQRFEADGCLATQPRVGGGLAGLCEQVGRGQSDDRQPSGSW